MVIGDQPSHAPGLTNWPECDRDVQKIVEAICGKNPAKINPNVIGKGMFVWRMTPDEMLPIFNTPPDFTAPDGNRGFEFIHRVIGDADFYFVSNQTAEEKKGDFLFRAKNRIPELWDPVTGAIRALPEFSATDDSRTKIPMSFAPCQSFFVAFQKPLDSTIVRSRRRGNGSEGNCRKFPSE